MGDWIRLAEAPWQQGLDCVFDGGRVWRTPPSQLAYSSLHLPHRSLKAPRKPSSGRRTHQAFNLKPRRLVFDEGEHQQQPLAATTAENVVASSSADDSGVCVWATTTAALGPEDADKENRPEPTGNKAPGPNAAKGKKKGGARAKEEERRRGGGARREAVGVGKSDFRPMRI